MSVEVPWKIIKKRITIATCTNFFISLIALMLMIYMYRDVAEMKKSVNVISTLREKVEQKAIEVVTFTLAAPSSRAESYRRLFLDPKVVKDLPETPLILRGAPVAKFAEIIEENKARKVWNVMVEAHTILPNENKITALDYKVRILSDGNNLAAIFLPQPIHHDTSELHGNLPYTRSVSDTSSLFKKIQDYLTKNLTNDASPDVASTSIHTGFSTVTVNEVNVLNDSDIKKVNSPLTVLVSFTGSMSEESIFHLQALLQMIQIKTDYWIITGVDPSPGVK